MGGPLLLLSSLYELDFTVLVSVCAHTKAHLIETFSQLRSPLLRLLYPADIKLAREHILADPQRSEAPLSLSQVT